MPIKINVPERTCTKKYLNYRSYKDYLREDFYNCCGYCDDNDMWSGGKRAYHIDHFAPKSLFSELENEYSNLIYSCPFCNGAKSNDWVTNSYDKPVDFEKRIGYIDPCDENYVKQFKRESDGSITPKSDVGKYMWEKLNLFLRRHKAIYLMNEAFFMKRELRDRVPKLSTKTEQIELLELICELDQKFDEYFTYISK